MKVSKLIIPLLGLTSINNNKELLQIEKEIKPISYEVLMESDWDNYLVAESLIQSQITQLDIQNIFTEIANKPKPMPINQLNGCDALLTSMLAGCARYYNPIWKANCIAAAWASYWVCMGVSA